MLERRFIQGRLERQFEKMGGVKDISRRGSDVKAARCVRARWKEEVEGGGDNDARMRRAVAGRCRDEL